MSESLTALLEQEHHDIDAGLEAFRAGLSSGETRREELTRAADALRRHIYLEEEFLFPPLRDGGMIPPVLVMLREHGEIWRALDALEEVDTAPEQRDIACGELLDLLARHNAKEEPIIYPRGDEVLSEEAKDDLRRFIETGRMPEGWVCAQA